MDGYEEQMGTASSVQDRVPRLQVAAPARPAQRPQTRGRVDFAAMDTTAAAGPTPTEDKELDLDAESVARAASSAITLRAETSRVARPNVGGFQHAVA